jgi:ubiquitin-like protein Pup
MSDRERSQPRDKEKKGAEDQPAEKVETEANLEALDDLLDEIDEVLEENAEEFVKNYVQKGGE